MAGKSIIHRGNILQNVKNEIFLNSFKQKFILSLNMI